MKQKAERRREMDQEQYLKNRMEKAVRIANELGFIIEHTLGIPTNISNMPFVVDFREEHEDYFQGRKLYKLMKGFLDLSLKHDEDGNYPEEIINQYLEDMAEFSFHPKYEQDVFEFTLQDHTYKIEVVMDSVVSMTLVIKDEWIQTRVVKEASDFAAVMKILDNMKGMYETNPYADKGPFIKYYNNIVRIADSSAPGWREVEKKVFVPYSMINDIYISPFNSEQFMTDFYKELENSRSRLSGIKDKEERRAAEAYLDFFKRWRDEDTINELNERGGDNKR
ncbi:MAG: hypothetical protein WCH76_06875, partial [Candidatus Riflemargulisbacteria bacterium]